MGIYCKQYTVGFKVYRETDNGRKCIGVERVKDLPLMTRDEAEKATEIANGNSSGVEYVTINTLSE